MQIMIDDKTFEVEVLKAQKNSDDKCPIVILHGFPDKAHSWFKIGEHFQSLGHDVIIPTLRGYYPSYSPEEIDLYDLDFLASDIAGILQNLKVEKVILIGHDWGGMLAWHFTHLNPSRVIKIVTISVPHPILFRNAIMKNPKQWLNSWYIFFFKFPFVAENFLARNNFRNLKGALRSGCKERIFSKEENAEFVKSWHSKEQLSRMISWYRALKLSFNIKKYQEYSGPALQIIGDSDRYFVLDSFKTECPLVKKLKTSELKNCGHWPHFEKRHELQAILTQFTNEN